MKTKFRFTLYQELFFALIGLTGVTAIILLGMAMIITIQAMGN